MIRAPKANYRVYVYWNDTVTSKEFSLSPTAIEYAREQHEKGASMVDIKDLESGKVILTLTEQ